MRRLGQTKLSHLKQVQYKPLEFSALDLSEPCPHNQGPVFSCVCHLMELIIIFGTGYS